MSESLTPLQKLILDVIDSRGIAMTRKQIAKGISESKNVLNPWDVKMLEDLVERGLVDKSETQIGPVAVAFTYTIAPKRKTKRVKNSKEAHNAN